MSNTNHGMSNLYMSTNVTMRRKRQLRRWHIRTSILFQWFLNHFDASFFLFILQLLLLLPRHLAVEFDRPRTQWNNKVVWLQPALSVSYKDPEACRDEEMSKPVIQVTTTPQLLGLSFFVVRLSPNNMVLYNDPHHDGAPHQVPKRVVGFAEKCPNLPIQLSA